MPFDIKDTKGQRRLELIDPEEAADDDDGEAFSTDGGGSPDASRQRQSSLCCNNAFTEWLSGGRSSSASDRSRELSACGALAVMAGGAALAALAGTRFLLRGERQVVEMIDADTGQHQESLVLYGMIFYAAVLICSGGAGLAGARLEAKWLLSTYLVLNSLLALVFFRVLAHGVEVVTTIAPVLARQGQEFCDGTAHATYQVQLGCRAAETAQEPLGGGTSAAAAVAAAASSPSGLRAAAGEAQAPPAREPCGAECAARVGVLQRMGGCSFLRALCFRYEFEEVGSGACTVAGGPAPLIVSPGPPPPPTTAPTIVAPAATTTAPASAGRTDEGTGSAAARAERSEAAAAVAGDGGGGAAAAAAAHDGGPGSEERRRLARAGPATTPRALLGSAPRGAAALACCVKGCSWSRSCRGFSFDESQHECSLVATDPPDVWDVDPRGPCSVYAWERLPSNASSSSGATAEAPAGGPLVADGMGSARCYRKLPVPVVVKSAAKWGIWQAFAGGLALIILLAASACGCSLQYSLATKRKGKKGAAAMLAKMMCPCFQDGHRVARFAGGHASLRHSESDCSSDGTELDLRPGKW